MNSVRMAADWGSNGGREPGFDENPSREPYFGVCGAYFVACEAGFIACEARFVACEARFVGSYSVFCMQD